MDLFELVQALQQNPDSWYTCSIRTGLGKNDPRLLFQAKVTNGGKHGNTPHFTLNISGGEKTCPLTAASEKAIFHLIAINRPIPRDLAPMNWANLVQFLSETNGVQFLAHVRTGHRRKDPCLGFIASSKEGEISLGISVKLEKSQTLFWGGDPDDQDIFQIHLYPPSY